MAKGHFAWRSLGMAAVIVATIALAVAAYGVQEGPEPTLTGPGVLVIDGMKDFGALERQPVLFQHDKHTQALAKAGKDCSSCHPKDKDGKLSLKFARTGDKNRKQVREIYHTDCIACHKQVAEKGDKAGPVVCGQCHTAQPGAASARVLPGFDKSLHARHNQAADKKCELCHHEYDKKAKKLVYKKGQEGSCRYCHGKTATAEVSAWRTVAHEGCISCHLEKLAKKKDAGPVKCAGCHDAQSLAKVKVMKDIPRMERKQPDVTFVKGGKPLKDGKFKMKLVPFDHQAHEAKNNNCIVCHHADLKSCSECHTVTGDKKGEFVNLERAMHSLGNDQSCLGCHARTQKDPKCAGCHDRSQGAFANTDSCKQCHLGEPLPKDASPQQVTLLAGQALARAREKPLTIADEDIPDKVKIGVMADEYQPAELPHRKIVKKLMEGMGKNQMAAAFHKDPGTICQGCHHNSPVSKKPPQCASCHGRPFNPQKPDMPGLKAAYHQQCMNCHKAMDLAKPQATACAECHKKKKD